MDEDMLRQKFEQDMDKLKENYSRMKKDMTTQLERARLLIDQLQQELDNDEPKKFFISISSNDGETMNTTTFGNVGITEAHYLLSSAAHEMLTNKK